MVNCYDHQENHDPNCPDCQFLIGFVTRPEVSGDAVARQGYVDHVGDAMTMREEAPELWSAWQATFDLPMIGVDYR